MQRFTGKDTEFREGELRIREVKLDIMAEKLTKKIKTNPKKETLACGWVVSFDKKKKGQINKLEWTHEILKDWKPETDL